MSPISQFTWCDLNTTVDVPFHQTFSRNLIAELRPRFESRKMLSMRRILNIYWFKATQ